MPQVKKPAPKILTVDEILDVDDLVTEVVECPEWGGAVKIKALSRRAVVEMQDACKDADGIIDMTKQQIELVLRGLCEPAVTPDRLEQLNGKHPKPLERIADRVIVISGLSSFEADEAGFPR